MKRLEDYKKKNTPLSGALKTDRQGIFSENPYGCNKTGCPFPILSCTGCFSISRNACAAGVERAHRVLQDEDLALRDRDI